MDKVFGLFGCPGPRVHSLSDDLSSPVWSIVECKHPTGTYIGHHHKQRQVVQVIEQCNKEETEAKSSTMTAQQPVIKDMPMLFT